MTRRQSNNQWSSGITAHPAPKNSEYENPLEKISPRFFGVKTASSSLIIFQRAELSTRRITHLCWWNWRTFWRKNISRRSPSRGLGLVLARQCPAHRALAIQKKLAYLCFQYLGHPLYSPDLDPSYYHLFPEPKKQLKDRHFSWYADVIAAEEIWLDEQHSDFCF